MAILLALVLIIAISLNVLQHFLLPANRSLPPVVFHWMPVIGSVISYGRDPVNFFLQCREKYGDIFTIILLGRRMTVALGPAGNRFILGGKSTIFNAEDAYKHLTTPVFGKDVVYDVPNHVFMEQKKFLKFGLTGENLRVYVGMIEDEVHQYLQTDQAFLSLKTLSSDEYGSFDVLKVLEEITILTAARTLQGREVRDNLDKTFSTIYKDLDGGFTPLNFLFPNLPLESYRRRDRAQKKMSQFFINIIQKRRTSSSHGENDMISSLLGQKYRDGRALRNHEIANMMIGLLMAGQHTSASTGAWALLHVAYNRNVADSLYEEQLEFFCTKGGVFRSMTYEELKKLPLLNAVITETLRLHPPIHSIMRYIREDVLVPSSLNDIFTVPRGHYALASPAVSQMDPHIWKSPQTWDPYRWIDSDFVSSSFSGLKKGTESVFQPFGSGQHRCIGEQFAYVQLGTIIATIIREVELRRDNGVPRPNYQTMITCPREPRSIFYRRRTHQ
ncbi:lanosterol 14-alpha-demethylase [Crucibulum laeve]|uniref:Lanosterol 14-alpha-demethylase n=1 Tax=Crucibulum laeve TaxID=68775 RepID=A0A5C3LVL0_9AGAR|nr:lanosterol 14-alpha-demethylase [Crucibulum laeve]